MSEQAYPQGPRYIVGIDLGTTHSVVAFTAATPPADETPRVELLPIAQVVAPHEVKGQALLPSFLLMPGPHDVPAGALALPWNHDINYTVGEFARTRGAELPARLVASAKSWLSHRGVDRTAPILPWDAPADVERISPLDTSARYLEHIRDAWNFHMQERDGSRLQDQELYLTVPASFDAVARELTVRAAQAAGLGNLTLLEEPQAAFYAWIEAQRDLWREQINVGETILVCDVGGGTTDFSLIQVTEAEGSLELQRVAVGEHILLGGDNMDLTLAYAVRAKLAQRGTQLDNWQFRGLVYSCRRAKERLLGDAALEMEPVTILGRGSSLIGNTIRTELTRQEIKTVLLQGFFPLVAADEFPQRRAQSGIREMGLPYASDPAITRHLAAFLARQTASDGTSGVRFPAAVLFNGGVMNAASLREQVVRVLEQWSGGAVRELPNASLDLAVAQGAAYYGLARQGRGIRIRAGAPRTYYLGVESSMPAVPGIPTPMTALCVVPFGMEEGTHVDIRDRTFGLVVGEQAVFHFLASTTRKQDHAGEVVEDWSGEIEEVATLEATLPATDDEQGGTIVPIWLESHVTPIGTLDLWCVANNDAGRRWKLEFNIRERATEEANAGPSL